jgi:hypothetical protein
MATSGNYSFTFDAGELVTEAAERAGLDPSDLSSRHMISMRRSLNLTLQNLEIKSTDSEYRLDRITQSLATGVRAYELPVGTIDVLDLVITDTSSPGSFWNPTRTTREDYMRLEAINTSNGSPTLYWVSRELPADPSFLDTPTNTYGGGLYDAGSYGMDGTTTATNVDDDSYYLIMWPPPQNDNLAVNYYRFRKTQKVGSLAEDVDVRDHWYDAISWGLAWRTAQKFNPDREDRLEAQWLKHRDEARSEDRPRGDVIIGVRGFGRSRRRRI